MSVNSESLGWNQTIRVFFKASQGLQRAAKFENQSFTIQSLVRYSQIARFANILPNEHLLAVIHSTLLVSSSQTLACIRITWRARCWKRNLSDSLGLGWSPMFCISEKFPRGLDAAVRNHLWEAFLMTVVTTLLPKAQWPTYPKSVVPPDDRRGTIYQTSLDFISFHLLMFFFLFPSFVSHSPHSSIESTLLL